MLKSLFDELPPMEKEAVPQGKEKFIFDGHNIINKFGKIEFVRRGKKNVQLSR